MESVHQEQATWGLSHTKGGTVILEWKLADWLGVRTGRKVATRPTQVLPCGQTLPASLSASDCTSQPGHLSVGGMRSCSLCDSPPPPSSVVTGMTCPQPTATASPTSPSVTTPSKNSR